MSVPITGGCLCGAIRYSISAPVTELRACHCQHCQKASGTFGSVNAVVPAAAFQITRGTPKRYDASAESGRTLHRYFCGDCGSPLYSQRDTTPENLALRIGTLDNPGPMKVVAHIWTKSARSWDYMDPGTKQIAGQPDAPPAK